MRVEIHNSKFKRLTRAVLSLYLRIYTKTHHRQASSTILDEDKSLICNYFMVSESARGITVDQTLFKNDIVQFLKRISLRKRFQFSVSVWSWQPQSLCTILTPFHRRVYRRGLSFLRILMQQYTQALCQVC